MKVIVVGASGTLGSAVAKALMDRHTVVRVARTRGDFQVDITDASSIEKLYADIGEFDALISTTGDVHFGALNTLSDDDFQVGLRSKLMGQINLVMRGLKHVRPGGSFTLTTGQINEDPIRFGASGAMVNGGIEAFARSAAQELDRGIRINVVSPTVTEESWAAFGPYFPGQKPIPAADAANGYVKSVEGIQTGKVYRIGW